MSRLSLAGGQQRRLVEDVGQVGTGEARRAARDGEQVDPGRHRLALPVHLEDAVPADHVGGLDGDLAVEAARAQERGVEDVGAVGRRDEDDVGLDVEAVHLHEQLVEGLLALVVAPAQAGPTVPADGVDLVDEDDGRGVGLGLLEQVAHPGGADADEHLDEVGAGDRVERDARLAGDGPGEQGLAGAGRAVEQDALGDLGADREELGGLGEELLDLLQLLDRLVDAGDVGEGDLGRVLGGELGPGLAELHDPGAAALGLAHHEPEEADEQQHREDADEEGPPDALAGDLVVVAAGGRVVLDQLEEAGGPRVDVLGLDLRRVLDPRGGVGEGRAVLEVEVEQVVCREGGLVDLVLADELFGLGCRDARIAAIAPEGEHDDGDPDDHEQPEQRGPQHTLEIHDVRGGRPRSS